MNILIVLNTKLPVITYGGTERVVWYLASELQKKKHNVYFLSAPDSQCPFAKCLPFECNKPINEQIPEYIDVIHFHNNTLGYSGEKPYVITIHGNYNGNNIDQNAIFVSKNHAERNHSISYVYNGLDWDDYGELNSTLPRTHFHFLGKAAWRLKNVRGAISVVNHLPNAKIMVLGGTRINFKMGFRLTLSPKACFKGMVGGKKKNDLLQHSRGLIFPVRWDEPFGLAITESLYCGAPVFGTPYGSLPELITPETGFLTANKQEMINHIRNEYDYNPIRCHEYARDLFNSRVMAEKYIEKYEVVMNGEKLNPTAPYAFADENKDLKNYPFD